MIKGVVNAAREAVVPLTVANTAGRTQPIDAVIDTGFSGFLTLPAALVLVELGADLTVYTTLEEFKTAAR